MSRNRQFLIHPSTRAFVREGLRTPGYRLFDLVHGYVYARWPYLYIGIGVGEHPNAHRLAHLSQILTHLLPQRHAPEGDGSKPVNISIAATYHGKVVPLAAATQLVTVNEEVHLPNLEQIIPYDRARDIVLKNPDHIVALDCPCRSARPNPCKPLDVCLIVGEPFASFISEHQPKHTRWLTPNEAIEILRAEDERGHVHHAFFKDAMLGRFYAICNCCACCCGAMQAQRRGTPMLASSGYITAVDQDLCIGCGDCEDYCQFFALSLSDGHAEINQTLCMGCGVCVNHCEQGALFLGLAPARGEPLEIQKLIEDFQRAVNV